MRIGVQAPDNIRWYIQIKDESRSAGLSIPVHSIMLLRDVGGITFARWLATSRYHVGVEMYRVFTSHSLDTGTEWLFDTQEEADAWLRRVAIDVYRSNAVTNLLWLKLDDYKARFEDLSLMQ